MKRSNTSIKSIKRWTIAVIGCCIGLLGTSTSESVEAAEGLGGPPHIGTFEGSTTFMTTSSNGINPGLYLEVMDQYGNYTEYTSEEGVITLSNTKEGAYVTQAKLLGKTKYADQTTGEILDQWEEGRNLTLVSSEGPGLTTIGKNLFDSELEKGYISSSGNYGTSTTAVRSTNYIRVTPNTKYTINSCDYIGSIYIHEYDINRNHINESTLKSFATSANTYYLKFNTHTNTNLDTTTKFQLEQGPVATAYEPYQSNVLTVNDNLTLRGIEDMRDELDLITGEMVQNMGEIVLDGSENWGMNMPTNEYSKQSVRVSSTGVLKGGYNSGSILKCDKLPVVGVASYNGGYGLGALYQETLYLYIPRNLVGLSQDENTTTIVAQKVKDWLKGLGGIKVQYPFETPRAKTLTINSTYYFEPVLNREIIVNGTILPLVASVNIPTEPLSFIIDPNQADDQQFVAPDFRITNNTPTWIALELNAFEQTTNVLNDVLPEAHDNWRQLDRAQSKDMALALVPQPSEGWRSLDEGPRYVADKSNYYLGKVKEESTVEFTFSALHGRAFIESLAPQYRLSFVFGFNEK